MSDWLSEESDARANLFEQILKILKNMMFSLKDPLTFLENLLGKYKEKRGEKHEYNLTRCKIAYIRTRNKISTFFNCTLDHVDRAYNDFINNGIINHLSLYKVSRKDWDKLGRDLPLNFGELTIIYLLIRLNRPHTVIETGVAHGFSSSVILQALKDNGYGVLHSIDIKKKVGEAIPDNLKSRWKLHIGQSKELLPKIVEENEFQFFLHDSEIRYETIYSEFQVVYPNLSDGGILISDHVTRGIGKRVFNILLQHVNANLTFKYQNLGIIIKNTRAYL